MAYFAVRSSYKAVVFDFERRGFERNLVLQRICLFDVLRIGSVHVSARGNHYNRGSKVHKFVDPGNTRDLQRTIELCGGLCCVRVTSGQKYPCYELISAVRLSGKLDQATP